MHFGTGAQALHMKLLPLPASSSNIYTEQYGIISQKTAILMDKVLN
jgi:hypothetical protein